MSLHYLLDGYNLIHQVPRFYEGTLEERRGRLLAWLNTARPQGSVRNAVTVVFDGPQRFLPREKGLLVVLYSRPKQAADAVIERLVYQASDRTQMVVVTRDRAEADLVRGLGARVWDAQRLLEALSAEVE